MNKSKESRKTQNTGLPVSLTFLLPAIALILAVSVFLIGDPLSYFTSNQPPVEELSIQRLEVLQDGFRISVYNDGLEPVSISQVLVDDAYWSFEIQPQGAIPRLRKADILIPYPWVYAEAHEITLLTPTGATFKTEVAFSRQLPEFGWRQFGIYGLIGVLVGVIPVGLGMLWFPALRRLDRSWLEAILALTVGLLVFLLVDTFLEALELAREIPGFFQGIPLTVLAGLLTWFLLQTVRSTRSQNRSKNQESGLYLAGMIAFGIGLHNLGEGLAIGAAFATGEAALGSFLVMGFMIHNITEGIGIAAPLLPSGKKDGSERAAPAFSTFIWLTLLAGFPASLGAWLGGFAFSPILATLFLGIGLGAIWQVILEVTQLIQRRTHARQSQLFSWPNLAGFSAGVLIMYLTAFLT